MVKYRGFVVSLGRLISPLQCRLPSTSQCRPERQREVWKLTVRFVCFVDYEKHSFIRMYEKHTFDLVDWKKLMRALKRLSTTGTGD